MSSRSVHSGANASGDRRTITPLLDAIFGLFIWAAHLFVVYGSAAIACQLGLDRADGSGGTLFVTGLVLATVAAVAVVALHAVRRYRHQRAVPAQRFRLSLTLGCDAIAALAIAWQLFAILLVPLCA